MAQNLFGYKDTRGASEVTYNATPLSTAPGFDTSTAYNVGDYCFYQGALYRFVTAKSAGAWDAACVEAAVIAEDMKSVQSSLASKATAITETASGSIVSIEDGVGGIPVESLTVSIEPVQSGSGDPSPDNVRPISGFDAVKVTRTGKNLLDYAAWSAVSIAHGTGVWENNGVTLTATETDCYTQWQLPLCPKIPVCPGVPIKLTFTRDGNGARGTNYIFPNGAMTGMVMETFNSAGTFSMIYTPTEGVSFITFRLGVSTAGKTISYSDVMIHLASETDLTFEPYQNITTLDITIPAEAGTVYGGTLAVNPDRTGSLVVDRAMVDLGTLSWTAHQSIAHAFNYWLDARKGYSLFSEINKKNICSSYTFYDSNDLAQKSSGISYSQNSTNKTVFIKDDTCTTVAEITAALSGVKLVYELATPLTYQLTPAELTTLLGTNNIWADTGDVEVTYRADTKLYIHRLTKPTEDDMVANANIASGQFFMVGNSLYLSTTAISAGETIIVGTNCTALSLADALNQLNQ